MYMRHKTNLEHFPVPGDRTCPYVKLKEPLTDAHLAGFIQVSAAKNRYPNVAIGFFRLGVASIYPHHAPKHANIPPGWSGFE